MKQYQKIADKSKFFFVYWVWQFPQMLVGAILVKVTDAKPQIHKRESDGAEIIYFKFERNTPFRKFISGASLAFYSLLADNDTDETICHEYGHSIQSIIFGWLYLIIVGIPSAVGNLYGRTLKTWTQYERSYRYYLKQPWEWWADYLGKADRKKVLAEIEYENSSRYPAQADQVM